MRRQLIIFSLIFFYQILFGQNERISSLGNSTIALKDAENDLNLYDFGNNVAYLHLDKTFDVLYIRPGFGFSKLDYRRLYEPQEIFLYNLSFDGIKKLKEGTFRGYVRYEIENRKNVYRSLGYSPYNGNPFFMTDTTTGDFVYNGPKVGFQYSFEFLKNLFMGIELNYKIMDGLKNIYTRSKTLIRDIDGSYSLAYVFNEDFTIGGSVIWADRKESIEAKAEDLFDAEIFNYRGDTYAFKRRSQTVSQTYRDKSIEYSLQSVLSPFKNLKIGIKTNYLNDNLKTLYPYGMLKEYEEGHTVFENYSGKIKINISPLDNLLIGTGLIYNETNSWSRISEYGLMIWKWKTRIVGSGLGFSYKFRALPALVVMEINSGKIFSDSLKFIDNKFSKHNDLFYDLRAGLEFEILQNIFFRTGFERNKYKFDIIRGGSDVFQNALTFGVGLYNFESLQIDYFIAYAIQKDFSNRKNNYINSQLNIKIFNY